VTHVPGPVTCRASGFCTNSDKEVYVREGGAFRRGASGCGRTSRRLLARERGQGTVEYVALVALVALIMVGVLAAMKSTQFAEGQQIGSLILKKIAEAVSKVHY
jgi:Flp pilus assembly pilin Flp